MPAVRSLGVLHQQLLACLEHDLERQIDGRTETVGAMLWTERGRLPRGSGSSRSRWGERAYRWKAPRSGVWVVMGCPS